MITVCKDPVRNERTSDEWHPHNSLGIWHNMNVVPLVWPDLSETQPIDIEITRKKIVKSKILRDTQKIIKNTWVLCGIPETRPALQEAIRLMTESTQLMDKALGLINKEIRRTRRQREE